MDDFVDKLIRMVGLGLLGIAFGPVKDGIDIVNSMSSVSQANASSASHQCEELNVIAIQPVCKGSPSDHVTYKVYVQNCSSRSIALDRVEVNFAQFFYGERRPQVNKCCHNSRQHFQTNLVEIDVSKLDVGRPYADELDLSVPALQSRAFLLTIKFKGLRKGLEDRFAGRGDIVVHYGNSNSAHHLAMH